MNRFEEARDWSRILYSLTGNGTGNITRRERDAVGVITVVTDAFRFRGLGYIHAYTYFTSATQSTQKISTYKNNKSTLVLWLNERHNAS